MLGCHVPPGMPPQFEGETGGFLKNPFGRLCKVFDDRFERAIAGRVLVDLGCGAGYQTVAAAELGAAKAFGIEIKPKFAPGEQLARERGLADRVQFILGSMRDIGADSADIVLSQNSFEHFSDPVGILEDARYVLRPGGQFFITFGPPWRHPYGCHHFFMIKWPWMHFVWGEKRLMRLRQIYRDVAPQTFAETSHNRMTIRKLERLARSSGFEVTELKLTPIGGVPKLIARVGREYLTSHVSAILTK
jgi:SAM-dependent methyltransferase